METRYPPPWYRLLEQSHKKNHRNVAFVQMTNLRRNGQPSLHNIRFLDFLKDDPRYLLFSMAFNDHNLHGDIKSNPNAQLNWQMPISKEIYNFSGRFYITSSQNKITRFPAPKIILDEPNNISPREYWESLRCQLWNSLSSQSRATFTWPPSGEIPKSDKDSFKCFKLDSMLNSTNSVNSSEKILHDLAFENFCILIFKANEAMRFDYEAFPPKRIVYNFDDEENVWEVEEANP